MVLLSSIYAMDTASSFPGSEEEFGEEHEEKDDDEDDDEEKGDEWAESLQRFSSRGSEPRSSPPESIQIPGSLGECDMDLRGETVWRRSGRKFSTEPLSRPWLSLCFLYWLVNPELYVFWAIFCSSVQSPVIVVRRDLSFSFFLWNCWDSPDLFCNWWEDSWLRRIARRGDPLLWTYLKKTY